MFDVDELIDECRRAVAEAEPRLAVRDVLERTMATAGDVAKALAVERAEVVPLYAAPDLTVLHVMWAPGMHIRPHNHLMWAAIGLYTGQEDNTFYRRDRHGIVVSGGKDLREGDVALLGDDTIHGVTNPLSRFTGAIHVYGGDLTTKPGRSEWLADTGAEVPYDFAASREQFAEANAAADARFLPKPEV